VFDREFFLNNDGVFKKFIFGHVKSNGIRKININY
jgi:hypothetical protein